jgi:hypothetical protein
MSVNIYWTTWSYIPEDDTVHRLKGFGIVFTGKYLDVRGEEVTGGWR